MRREYFDTDFRQVVILVAMLILLACSGMAHVIMAIERVS